MYQDRIRMPSLLNRVMSADEAAGLIQDGMVVGMSGFTRAGDAKDIPVALARRAQQQPLKITLITGASLGHDSDKILVEAGVLARRMPFQVDTTLRAAINRGEVMFTDQHLSETVEFLRAGQYGDLDVAVLEAVAITEDGGIVPSSSVGNSASFAILAKKIIIELNLAQPAEFEGRTVSLATCIDVTARMRAEGAEAIGPNALRLVLTEGKYHQVKRMVAAVGNRVDALHRSRIGGLTLGDLAPGQWRLLDQGDLRQLFGAEA